MELFQELLFTILFSLIVSLLIAKLFLITSSFDEEKIEKEWVVCDSENKQKSGFFEDHVKDGEKDDFECFGGELGSGVVVKDSENVIFDSGVGACQVFDEMPERTEIVDDDGGLVGIDVGNVVACIGSFVEEDCVKGVEVEEVLSGVDVGEVTVEEEEEDEMIDDDWQGIETTELEKRFGAAVGFLEFKVNSGGVNLVDNEVKIELYGLHRVVIEGNCFEPQPMALKVSARANWNSWKRLENLGREDAMERYIALLSQQVPDWMGSHSSDKQ